MKKRADYYYEPSTDFMKRLPKMADDGRPKFTKKNLELLFSVLADLEINMELWHDEGNQEMIKVHLLVIE